MKFDINIINKIKDYLQTEKDSKMPVFDKDVAKELGMSAQNFAMRKNRDELPYEEIGIFCAKNKISFNWIVYGQIPDSLNEQTDKLINIRYLGSTSASAGGGAFNDSEDYENIAYPNYILKTLGYKEHLKNLEIISVSGDSMVPELSNADKVLIDRNKNIPNEKDIFIVKTLDGVFIKRIKKIDNTSIELVSSNNIYLNEKVLVSDIGILGTAIAVL